MERTVTTEGEKLTRNWSRRGDITKDATTAVGKAVRATTPGLSPLETIVGRCCCDPTVYSSRRGLMGERMWQRRGVDSVQSGPGELESGGQYSRGTRG